MNNAKNLSNRNVKWVAEARKVGDKGESAFEYALRNALPSTYEIVAKPRDLATIYGDYGVVPDLMVKSKVTGKRLFIEKKAGSQGGNAHERVYKYLSENLQKAVKREFCTPDNPFVFVFSGKTFLKEKYQQEIKLVCGHMPNNYLIWDGSQQQVNQYAEKIKDMLQ